MVNEYSSSRVFDALADQMARAEFRDELVSEVRAFAAEEREHGRLCGAVVEALGGEARAAFRDEGSFPEHLDAASQREAVLRNVLSVSCLSETVAVALIGAEREEMPDGPLRELLTGIWSDEVGHARFGWRLLSEYVPLLTDLEKHNLCRYLSVALVALKEHELKHLPVDNVVPSNGAELGLCNGQDARELFFETVRTAILPNLSALGLRPLEVIPC